MATISLDKEKIVGNEDISPSGEMIQDADFANLTLDAELIKYNDNEDIHAPGDKSLIDRMIESFYKRTGQVQKSREQFASGEITLPEHVLQSYGKGGAGMLLDTAGNIIVEGVQETWDALDRVEGGLRWVMPDGMEAHIDGFDKKMADKLTGWWENSPEADAGRRAIMAGAKKYSDWCEENPRACTNLESIVDIGLIFATPGKLIPWKGKSDTVLKAKSSKQLHLAKQQEMRTQYDKLWAQLYGKDRINEKNIGRVTIEGGVVRAQTINYNKYEKEFMDLLFANGVKKGNSATKNSEEMSKAIEKYAIQLRSEITKAGGGSKMPVSWQEVRSNVQKNIDDLVKSNPIFAESSQQSTIYSNLERFLKILDDGIKKGDFKGNPLGIFNLRQAYDDWVRTTAKSGKLDGSVPMTAMDESVRVIRTTLNDIVAAKLPNTPVKELLNTQTQLYKGRSLMLPAVKIDAKHALQSVWKNISSAVGVKMTYNRMMAVAFGASAYGMAEMTGASALLAVGIGGGVWGSAVALQTRASKIALGKTLALMDKVIGMPGANPNVVKALSADRALIHELFVRPIEKVDAEKDEAAVAIDRMGDN
jgi:hypothetical protein